MSATILLAANPLPLSLVTYLEALGHEVMMVEDGRRALGFLQRHTPDLLILDAGVLMMSGLGTCDSLGCVLGQRDLSVVMTSALAGFRERSAAQLTRARVVLKRPTAGEVAAVAEALLSDLQVAPTRRWRTAS